MFDFKLSVVDQVPVHNGKTQAQALDDALKLAQSCDASGYYRYWFAEHHATLCYACSAPELMISRVAAATENLRVGSGGVMMSHYSPYKVAELFRTLDALYPGRIDLGIGRAPGGAELPSRGLAYPHSYQNAEGFLERVAVLAECLTHDQLNQGALRGLVTTPLGGQGPERWMLGSSDGSIENAALTGWNFVLALFIGNHERPADIIERYKAMYRQRQGSEGKAMIAVASIAADSREEAEFLASTHTFWKLQSQLRGVREGLRSPKECMSLYKQLSVSERAFFDQTRGNMIVDTAENCLQRMEDLTRYYGVNEVMVVAVTHDFQARKQSYIRLAETKMDSILCTSSI